MLLLLLLIAPFVPEIWDLVDWELFLTGALTFRVAVRPSRLKLVKGRYSQERPDMLQEAIKKFLLTKATLDDGTQLFYAKALNAYQRVSPEWPPSLETVVRFINHYQTHYADSTAHVYYTVVRMFIAYLVKRRILSDNPLEDLSPPGSPDDLPRAPAAEVLECFFAHLENEVERVLRPGKKKPPFYGWREIRDLAYFSLLFDTGLRLREACNILVEDVDLGMRRVFVRYAKRKRQRYVVIGKRTTADLRLWFKLREKICLPEEELAYFFLRRYRGWGGITAWGMEQVLTQYCKSLAIEPFTPHQLRHAYVDTALKLGGDLREIQMQMGHLNLRTTLRYAKGVTDKRLEHHDQASPRDFLFR